MGLPQHFRRLQRLLLRRGNSPADTEDLIQEAFLKMQEYCAKGREVRQPEAFLVRTVLNLRANARRDTYVDLSTRAAPEEIEFVVDTDPAPDEVIARDQCLKRMRDALDAVSRKTREVFFMNRLDGLTYAEIASRLGVSVSAVEKHMMTAITVLGDANGWE
jgi:RNA polymerase sigma-70 factor (ECF subfamily)